VAERVAAVLADEPHLAVAAFVVLAERGRARLAAAVSALGAGALARLAEGAWRAVGGAGPIVATAADRLARVAGRSPGVVGGRPGMAPVRLASEARASSVVRRSRIVAAVAGRAHQPPAVRAGLAALAVLEIEPDAARVAAGAGGDPVALVAAVAEAMSGGGAGPELRDREASVGDVVAVPTEPAAGGTAAEPSVPATTAWGGLLFLVHVLDDLGVPDRLLASPDVAAAGLRAVLHALGTALLARAVTAADPPVAPDDPALLAFCGLVPADRPPDLPDEARSVLAPLVDREVDAVAGELARRLPLPPGDGERGHEDRVLEAVCRRRADVVADPGWIDVVLDLDGVSTDVRRVGLDLDPGFVGWLGVVVRFRYA
jgi:hypothetical protein